MTDKQEVEFRNLVRPLIEFLRRDLHPHHTIIIDCAGGQILEGLVGERLPFESEADEVKIGD